MLQVINCRCGASTIVDGRCINCGKIRPSSIDIHKRLNAINEQLKLEVNLLKTALELEAQERQDKEKDEFKFYPNASQRMYMDDVRDISLKTMELIEEELNSFGAKIGAEQEDDIYIPLFKFIEKYSNGEYRSNN